MSPSSSTFFQTRTSSEDRLKLVNILLDEISHMPQSMLSNDIFSYNEHNNVGQLRCDNVCCRSPRYFTGMHSGLTLYSGASNGFTRYVSGLSPSFPASVPGLPESPPSAAWEPVDGVGTVEDVAGCEPADDVLTAAQLLPFLGGKSTSKPPSQPLPDEPGLTSCHTGSCPPPAPEDNLSRQLVKAKFHYASWFEAGRRQVRSQIPLCHLVRSWSQTCSKLVGDQL